MSNSHEPWNPWSLWCATDLEPEAIARLSEGGIWRLATPPEDFEVTPQAQYFSSIIRTAIYRGRISDTRGRIDIEGRWESPGEEWVRVGWIEYD